MGMRWGGGGKPFGRLLPTIRGIRRRKKARRQLREVWVGDTMYLVRPAKKKRRRRR